MSEQRLIVSERELEEFDERFRRRYIFKKKANAILCFFIAMCGTSAVLYSRFIFHNALLDRLRYMTFWGTIFTSAVSLIFGIVCIVEAAKETETTARWAPYSFLDFENTTIGFKMICLVGIFTVGYLVAWMLMRLNMKLSWIWFFDIKRRKKKG